MGWWSFGMGLKVGSKTRTQPASVANTIKHHVTSGFSPGKGDTSRHLSSFQNITFHIGLSLYVRCFEKMLDGPGRYFGLPLVETTGFKMFDGMVPFWGGICKKWGGYFLNKGKMVNFALNCINAMRGLSRKKLRFCLIGVAWCGV